MPLRQRSTALGTLLAACRVHGNRQMGEAVGQQLMDLDLENSIAYSLVSNLYAEDGKWNDATRKRAVSKDRGLKGLLDLA